LGRSPGLLEKAKVGLQFNEHITAPGDIVLRHACALGLEGIVSKRLGSRYVSGRSRDWLKFKFLFATIGYFKALGVILERVMTDIGSCYLSKAFARACKAARRQAHQDQALHDAGRDDGISPAS
jgi:hypothetical protein